MQILVGCGPLEGVDPWRVWTIGGCGNIENETSCIKS